MKKVVSVISAALIVASLFAGCAKNNATTISSATSSAADNSPATLMVYWWGNQTRNDRTQQVLTMYHNQHPNVTLQAQFVDWNSYWNKLATLTAANDTPDVIQMDYSYINQYVQNKLLLDLDPYIKNGEMDATNIPKTVLQSGQVSGKTYAISLGTNAVCLVYDPAIFQKANVGVSSIANNWTWSDFDNYAEKVFKATGSKVEPLFSVDGSTWIEYQARSAGYSFYSKDGKSLGFTDKKILTDIYNRMLTLTKDGSMVSPDKIANNTTVEQSPIVQGTAWLSSCWSNQFVAMQIAAKRPLTMINMPINANTKKQGLYDKPSMFFSVSATTKYKDAAVKFVSYFENDVDANKVLLGERGVPTSTKVLEGIKSLVPTNTAQTFDYVQMIDSKKLTGPIDPPTPAASAQVLKSCKDDYDKVAYQKATPDAAADEFMKAANSILATS